MGIVGNEEMKLVEMWLSLVERIVR